MMKCALEESCRHVDVLYKSTSLPVTFISEITYNVSSVVWLNLTKLNSTFLTPGYRDQNADGPVVPVFLVPDPSSQMRNPNLNKTSVQSVIADTERVKYI